MGFVYFAQARHGRDLSIKIGRTDQCPQRRLQEVKRKHPTLDSLAPLGVIETPNPKKEELAHHKRFADLRVFGYERDWFRADPTLHDFIQGYACIHICDPHCHQRTPGDVLRKQQVDAFRERLSDQLEVKVRAFETELLPRKKGSRAESSKTLSSPN